MTYLIWTKKECGACVQAKAILNYGGLPFIEMQIETEHDLEIFKSLGHKYVPQIYSIETSDRKQEATILRWIGGFECLKRELSS